MALQEELKQQGDFLFKHRSYLPLIVLVVGLLVFVQTESSETEAEEYWLFDNFEYICLAVSLLGFFIRVHTIGYTAKNTSGRNTTEGQIADVLNTTGMYSMVRHPLYLGNFFMWLGVALLTENFWFIVAFVFFYAGYYMRIMYAEESYLRSKFKEKYTFWAQHTPVFIPSSTHYKKPISKFNLKKVLKKEKNGLAAIFLLFWLFECVGEIASEKKLVFEYNFWFYAAITATILYVVLKILKKKKMLES